MLKTLNDVVGMTTNVYEFAAIALNKFTCQLCKGLKICKNFENLLAVSTNVLCCSPSELNGKVQRVPFFRNELNANFVMYLDNLE